jgi:hypothetical protein
MDRNICLIYLGKRGGGARLTRDIALDLIKSGVSPDIIYRENSEFADFFQSTGGVTIPIKLPKSNVLLIAFGIKYVRKILNEIVSTIKKTGILVFVMPHPLNKHLLKKLSRIESSVTTVSIIHDDKAHSGEIWPSRREIQKNINNSEIVIFLSNYVKNQFEHRKNFLVSQLEALPLLDTFSQNKNNRQIVVPGRIKKYKNIVGIYKIAESLNTIFEVRIVGFGKLPKEKSPSNVLIENKWIDAFEFDKIIAESAAILNLYTESTQSGPIAIAKAYGVPIIYNGEGGTVEQIEDYPNKILALNEMVDVTSLMDSLRSFKRDTNRPGDIQRMKITKLLLSLRETENQSS